MPHEIKVNKQYDLVEIAYIGLITPGELVAVVEETMVLARGNGILKFFADCTTMIGGHSITDLYGLISLYESIGVPHGMKEAILLPALTSAAADVRFYETACYNKGYNVKVFKNSKDALNWLVEGK